MKKSYSIFAVLAFALSIAAAPASAGLVIDVVGKLGTGVTTWTFSGSSSASQDGTIRDDATDNTFDAGDSFEVSANSGDFIGNAAISNQLFEAQGSAEMTIGGVTGSITHVFLDDDGLAFDDIGLRTDNALTYVAGEATQWSGVFTLAIDISNFMLGTFLSASNSAGGFSGPWFSQDSDVMINVAVPETGTIALFGAGLLGLGLARRKKAA